MRIAEGVEAVEGLPLLHIKKLDSVVCSDLHLGYEGVMAEKGTFLPKVNLKSIKTSIKKAIEETGAKNIIIDGDIKNEFSTVHAEELNEFYEFSDFLAGDLDIKKVTIIKGNHDNFINRITGKSFIKVHEREVLSEGFLFFHGEEIPESNAQFMIMGHMHPAITIYDDIGSKEKLKCFLSGSTRNGSKLVVLPAISYFAEGVSVNLENVSTIAPIFKLSADIDNMEAICIGDGETLSFGKIGDLKKVSSRW